MLYIANDHAGLELKMQLITFLRTQNIAVQDLGTDSPNSCDYPDYAHLLAQNVAERPENRGILICGSGVGVSIAANRHKNVRAALCWLPQIATLARQHNDANVVCLPARFIDAGLAQEVVTQFLATAFEGGRHQTRVSKIEL